MTDAVAFDLIDLDHLRGVGGLKWTLFPDTIGAFVAEMDFGTAPVVTQALHDAIDRSQFGYLPPSLALEMGEAVSTWQRDRYGWDVPAQHIHPIADVIKGLEIAIEHYSEPGSAVILPTPGYMPFLDVPGMLGREVVQLPLLQTEDGAAMDLEGLAAAFRRGAGLLVLVNPYNPVGRVFTTSELTAISEVVAAHGGRVFADEIHAPLVYADATHVPYASLSATTGAHTVTAISASKAWNLPGLKCAQLIITSEADAAIWAKIEFFASHGASTLGVIANTVAYADGGPWLDEVIGYLDQNRARLVELVAEHLPGVVFSPPQGTYIAWLDCRPLGLDESAADFFLREAGVALTDGITCGAAGEGFVRFIFATPRPILEQAVVSMGRALRRRG